MIRLFRMLLRLYPERIREVFGEEMISVWERTWAERKGKGLVVWAGFCAAEIAALMWDALRSRVGGKERFVMIDGNRDDLPEEVLQAEQQVAALVTQMVSAIAGHKFEEARRCSNQEREARERLRSLREKYNLGNEPGLA